MKLQEQKYALERAEGIFRVKRDKLYEKHRSEKSSLTADEMREALRSGRFTVRADGGDDYSAYITHLVKFTDDPSPVIKARQEQEHANLKASYDRLRDELMLGEAAEALKLLRAFAEAPEDAPSGT